MSRRHLLFAIVALTSTATAQVAETWTLPIDQSPIGDALEASLVDADGASTHVGAVLLPSFGSYPSDASITRVDPQGVPLWNRTLSLDFGWRTAYVDVERGPAGSFYVGGSTRSTASVNYSAVLARYASDGTQMWWLRSGNAAAPADVVAIATDPGGDLWAVGSAYSPIFPYIREVLVLRVSPTGSILFARTWSDPAVYNPGAREIVPDGQGGAYIVGGGSFVAESTSNAFLLRVDAGGNTLWSRVLSGGYACLYDVAVDPTGSVYVTGQIAPPASLERPFLAKYTASGTPLWQRTASDADHYIGTGRRVEIDPRGDVIVAGTWGGWLPSMLDILVTKYAANGNVLWVRNWAGPSAQDEVRALALDAAGEIAVAGLSVPVGQTAFTDALALRLDRDGRVLWSRSFGLPTNMDQGTGIGFGPLGAVIFAAVNGLDALVVRLDDTSIPFCFGDGSGTACPCGNTTPSSERSGCWSTLGVGGRLTADGSSSLAGDTLTLRGSSMPNVSALFFQGTTQVGGGAGATFGDGLRCAGGSTVRLKTVVNAGGASQFPVAGDPSVSARGQVTSPGTRTYQVWYRNSAPFCTSDTFNLTNGVAVTWTF